MKLIKNATSQKLRGGFYTPEPMVDFILKWAFNGKIDQDILEPSSGDGVFLERIKANKINYKSVTAVELDRNEAKKTKKLGLKSSKIINEDFHTFCNKTKKRFDVVVGNPPYIRYQYFDKNQQLEANKIFEKSDLKYSKLTNAWVSFVIGSCQLLNEGGKIGFVLPAELLQVSYAKTLRNFLAHFFNKVNIISFKKLVFPEVQQEVILLLCEKNGNNKHLIEHLEVNDIKSLVNIDVSLLKRPKKEIDFKNNKWTFYFLDQEEIDFLESLNTRKKVPYLKEFANVEVGITTGANPFFTVDKSTVERFNLKEYAKPLVGRSVQVNSIIFTKKDWERNRDSKARAHLLVFPCLDKLKKNKKAMEYLKLGESNEIQKGYKCGIRDEWQIVPSIRASHALFIRRNNIFPKLIENKVGAYTTDTMHRVSIKEGVNSHALISSYYNSLSLASAEIAGRSHGGGVLELMPNEVGEIILPYKEVHAEQINKIDAMVRDKTSIDEILSYTDEIILRQGFGFTKKEIKLANSIWKKLRDRRLNRSRS